MSAPNWGVECLAAVSVRHGVHFRFPLSRLAAGRTPMVRIVGGSCGQVFIKTLGRRICLHQGVGVMLANITPMSGSSGDAINRFDHGVGGAIRLYDILRDAINRFDGEPTP